MLPLLLALPVLSVHCGAFVRSFVRSFVFLLLHKTLAQNIRG